ncbi:hypothetical protein MAMP_00225 [Methylophaga aminisulfidivorans MP]|uniref:Uncharacterized protein n=1 Tax=Methylophaga aminisulfidivorans MP TaxID=1026882 RepID=F5T1H5_9GAMM|nr:hypothetical protein [Methylophaga aminisulfidivorans]EGL53071.1 hypothetical protein MAMP_00225 [Methylophaga aminisulfidivorans MP]
MISRVEFSRGHMNNIYCPFCGQRVLDLDFTADQSANPCLHTLFVAHDYEIEYLSDELKEIYSVSSADQLEELDSFENIDSFTNNIDLKNAVKFAQYEGAPRDMADMWVSFKQMK